MRLSALGMALVLFAWALVGCASESDAAQSIIAVVAPTDQVRYMRSKHVQPWVGLGAVLLGAQGAGETCRAVTLVNGEVHDGGIEFRLPSHAWSRVAAANGQRVLLAINGSPGGLFELDLESRTMAELFSERFGGEIYLQVNSKTGAVVLFNQYKAWFLDSHGKMRASFDGHHSMACAAGGTLFILREGSVYASAGADVVPVEAPGTVVSLQCAGSDLVLLARVEGDGAYADRIHRVHAESREVVGSWAIDPARWRLSPWGAGVAVYSTNPFRLYRAGSDGSLVEVLLGSDLVDALYPISNSLEQNLHVSGPNGEIWQLTVP